MAVGGSASPVKSITGRARFGGELSLHGCARVACQMLQLTHRVALTMSAEPPRHDRRGYLLAKTLFNALNQLTRRYSHVNWALADQGIVSGANFLTAVLLARYLGVDGYGVYTLGWLVLVFVGSIHAPLIIASMMTIGPTHSGEDAPGYYGAVIVQNLVVSVVGTMLVSIGVYLSAWLLSDWGIERLLWPLATATFAALWQDFFRRYFFTRDRPAAAFTIDAIRYIGQIVVLFVLFQLFPNALDSTRAMWITAATAAVPVLICPFIMGNVTWSWHATRIVAMRHYRSSKWGTASAPLESLSEFAFFFAAGSIVGSAAVGAVRATQNIVGIAHIMFHGLLNVVRVSAAKRYTQGGLPELSSYLQQVAWKSGVATAVICLIFAVAPTFWLRLFFGEEFIQYGALVRWWALVYSVHVFVLPLRAGLWTLETTRPIFLSRIWAVLFALAAASAVISWFGLEGVVVGILISKLIIVLSLWWSAASVFYPVLSFKSRARKTELLK
jgi:O-antigen/teichoic acid export membrane protein